MDSERYNYFRKRVCDYTIKMLRRDSLTFEQLLQRSLNCDPVVLMKTLQQLNESNFISFIDDEAGTVKYSRNIQNKNLKFSEQNFSDDIHNQSAASAQTSHLQKTLKEILNSLPEPTPVYSQWWFSKSIYGDLVKLLTNLTKPRTSAAFLGCATLGAYFSHFSGDPIHIFDIDKVLLNNIQNHCSRSTRVIQYNASDEPEKSFNGSFQLFYVDPPWSSALLRTFLIRSSAFVAIGGKLVISFPQLLTRPSILIERRKLMQLAKKLGLSLDTILPSFTEYSVPVFEKEAYSHHGISLKKPWRRGDLFIFTKTTDSTLSDTTSLIEKTPSWNQYENNGSRFFLKRDGLYEEGDASIKPLPGLEDFLYKTTSSRMTSWKAASLVSSRNFVARAYGRNKLSALLEEFFAKGCSAHDNHVRLLSSMPIQIKKTFSTKLDNFSFST